MLDCLEKRVRDLKSDKTQGKRLSVIPILGPSRDVPAYSLLTPANYQQVQISEIDESGSVPVLKVVNETDTMVFLMDGQELLGAKQNRILNTDVLVPAKGSIKIPVSCVEQGRWSHQSALFSPGKSASHRTRSAKAQRVHQSLREKRGHDADQHAVWQEVAETMQSAEVASPSGALHKAYQERERDLDAFRNEVRLPDSTVGVAIYHRDQFLGLDLFDRESTLKYFWNALADSYAIDVLHEPVEGGQPASTAQGEVVSQLLHRAAVGNWEVFETPGEGRDYRLDDKDYAGASLVWGDEAVVHLQLFPKTTPNPSWRPRIRRTY